MATKTKTKTRRKPAKRITAESITMPMRWAARLHCSETGTGVVILTDEQARALVATVAAAVEAFGPPPGPMEKNLLIAVDAIDRTFGLGIAE